MMPRIKLNPKTDNIQEDTQDEVSIQPKQPEKPAEGEVSDEFKSRVNELLDTASPAEIAYVAECCKSEDDYKAEEASFDEEGMES